jgi:uncharacterized protein YbcI
VPTDGAIEVRDPAEIAEVRASKRSAAMEISNGLVQLASRYAGRGPTRARTTLNTNIAVTVFEDALTQAELTLAGVGRDEVVRSMRANVADVIREQATDVVERVTGRTVTSALHDIDVQSNVAAFVFVLEPLPEEGIAETASIEV